MEKINLNGVAYPTSYGIGISTLCKSKKELNNIVKEVEKILFSNGYNIRKKEFSDQHWVYRLIISTKNLKRS